MKGMFRLARTRRRALVTVLALAAAAFALASCSRRIANPDASYTVPEGVLSDSANLIVWADEPNPVYFYEDRAPVDADAGDILFRVEDRRRGSPGSVNGMILDGTTATDYQVFRREPGGGVRQFTDFPALRTQRWLESGWEAYTFRDPSPVQQPPTYVARGLRGGVANATSPLTQSASAAYTPVEDLGVRAVWYSPRLGIKITWNDHPDAERYWIQIYTFRGDLRSTDEKILSGTPSALYDGQSHSMFIASLLAPRNFYIAGFHSVRDSVLDHARILSHRGGDFLSIARVGDRRDTSAARLPFRVRVSAVDAQGRIIATSRGASNLLTALRDGEVELQRGAGGVGTYALYRLNSASAIDTAVSVGPALVLPESDRATAANRKQAGRTSRF